MDDQNTSANFKTVVIGANGQLGSDVVKVLKKKNFEVFPATRNDVDITISDQIERLFERVKPDAVINCAAFHDVPKCEEDPAIAMKVNAEAVESLAKICHKNHLKLLTISSDYVFDGTKEEGYSEEDNPNPLMWYGKSKLAGERAALENHPQTFVVRVQSLYGENRPRGKNLHFVDLMLKLADERPELKVDQCQMGPTWTYPLANNLIALLETDHYGICHMSSIGKTTWYAFAREIMKLANKDVNVIPVANDFFPKNFERPEKTYLLKNKLDKIGLNFMPTWQDSLKGYLSKRG